MEDINTHLLFTVMVQFQYGSGDGLVLVKYCAWI